VANETVRSIRSMRTLIDRVPLGRDNLWGQGMRFAITGVVVSIVYIGITTILAASTKLPFQVGLAIGWCAAVAVHFTLQRVFVWTHDEGFALPFRHQVGRYLLVAGSQFGVTAIGTAVLPPVLGLSAETIYLGMAVIITVANFLVFRYGVFHPDAAGGARQA
jgi:putative flippase GtrA